jgi:hypothetical protein
MHNKKMGGLCSAEGAIDRKAPNTESGRFGNICIIFVLISELLTEFVTLTTQHA